MRHGALILGLAAVLTVGCGGNDDDWRPDAGGGDSPVQYDVNLPPQDAQKDAQVDVIPDCGALTLQTDGGVFVATPASIQFTAVHPLPTGEQILFNDWNTSPNKLFSMTPDGQTVTEVFQAYRIWSMGISHARDRIAFSSGDPNQEAHYDLLVGDSIQHTFLYDVATQTVALVSDGNLNDECHAFSPNDDALYVCRRYDFAESCDGWDLVTSNRGWRLGRIALPGKAFTFLTPDVDRDWALSPQPTPDGTALFYARIQISGTTQTRTIMKMTLPGGTTELWKEKAAFPVLSPNGAKLAYQNWDDGYTLYVANVDGSQPLQIANRPNFSEAVFSPDGTQVAYLPFDDSVCHIEVVKVDGTEANAPRCLRPASAGDEFITELDWITR